MPFLTLQVSLLMRLEREVEEEFRPQMRARLEERITEAGASHTAGAPTCPTCERRMKSRGRKPSSILTRFGKVAIRGPKYRCKACGTTCRPWHECLGLEVGRISGSLARLLALLGVIVPYEMAARLAFVFFGVEVSTMSVWRCVQRLGEACEQYTEALVRYHADPHCDLAPPTDAPDVVVAGVDGCALGMQVRKQRRRRSHPDEALPELPAVEEGHFREVKTGVVLLPSERVETSPGRRSVLRRMLVSCLGGADQYSIRYASWQRAVRLNWRPLSGRGRAVQNYQNCERVW